MRKPSVSRRRFLATAGAGGAALALSAANGEPAAAGPRAAAAGDVSPPLLEQLAEYADVPLSPAAAAQLAPGIAGAIAILREAQVPDYLNLQPATIFRVEPEA
jgi:hypothetical protein